MNLKAKIVIACVVLLCCLSAFWIASTSRRKPPTFTYSQFLDQVREGKVAGVVIAASNSGAAEATCRLKDGRALRTVLPSNYCLALKAMQDSLVDIEIRDASFTEPRRLVKNAAPFLVLLGVWAVLLIYKRRVA